MAVVIQTEKLLRELDGVWISLGKQQQESGGVLRACAMTLIALTEDGPQSFEISETLAALMHDHPARAIVVRVGGSELDARCTAQCWKPFGRRQQICCEQIEIDAPELSLAEVPAVLRGLMVPDLPVVVWLRHAGLLRHPQIDAFVDLADKLIVEAREFPDWAWLAGKLRSLSELGKRVADLSWTRLTRWREAVAGVFDTPATAAGLGNIREIAIRCSPQEPAAAAYLTAWIRLSLGRNISDRLELSAEDRNWPVQEINLLGEGVSVSIRRLEQSVVEIRAPGFTTCTVFEVLQEADLLREELSIPDRDPVFERVLRAV